MTNDHFCADLITLIEVTIREESSLRNGRPIYLLGEGYGALLAICIAARNPDLDLVLILVDPGMFVCLTSPILFFFLLTDSLALLVFLVVSTEDTALIILVSLHIVGTWCDESDILPPGVAVLDAAPGLVSSSLPFLFSMSVGATRALRF